MVCVASRDLEHAREAAAWIGSGVEAVSYRELGARAARLLAAVSDGAITGVAAEVAAGGPGITAALHTCGAAGPDALAPLRTRGAACGVLHPLQTFPTPDVDLRGVFFGVWGDECAVRWAEEIAAAAKGRVLGLAESAAPLYHAAAVMASNYITTLVSAAQSTLAAAGVGEADALRALAPLVRASVENAVSRGPAAALTGPIERGDLATVSTHLRALSPLPESVRSLYRAAGLETIELARRRGLPPQTAAALERLLEVR